MSTVVGAVIVIAVSVIWGAERAKRETEKLSLLEGLILFITYTEEQITNFRTPLSRIFEDFSNEELEGCGFCKTLTESGAEDAVNILQGKIPESAYKEAQNFAKGLGGGYSEGQSALCTVTAARLERIANDIRGSLPEKVRMYRLLPVLLAASVIILLL